MLPFVGGELGTETIRCTGSFESRCSGALGSGHKPGLLPVQITACSLCLYDHGCLSMAWLGVDIYLTINRGTAWFAFVRARTYVFVALQFIASAI